MSKFRQAAKDKHVLRSSSLKSAELVEMPPQTFEESSILLNSLLDSMRSFIAAGIPALDAQRSNPLQLNFSASTKLANPKLSNAKDID